MPRLSIGTTPRMVGWRNTRRFLISAQLVPTSIIAGNTGLVFGKFGSAPIANTGSNTWDFVLNAGASDGSNINGELSEAPNKEALYLIADTADQIVNVIEETIREEEPQKG